MSVYMYRLVAGKVDSRIFETAKSASSDEGWVDCPPANFTVHGEVRPWSDDPLPAPKVPLKSKK